MVYQECALAYPLQVHIWLRGWSDALAHAAFAQAVDWDDELPF